MTATEPLVGATPVAEIADRAVDRISGRVVAVEIEPASGPAQMTARIDDGTGRVDAVFLGRRSVPGIVPGATVTLSGRFRIDEGRTRIFNPRYELLCR